MGLKEYVLSIILAFGLTIPLIAVEGRYKEFMERSPRIAGVDQYKAILLIEKIKKEKNKKSQRIISLKTMLDVELDNLEDKEDFDIAFFKTQLEKQKERLAKAATEEERREALSAVNSYRELIKTREESLQTIKSLRRYTLAKIK